MSLQPIIDIPLIQITGIGALYENYEAIGTRQLGYEGRVRRRAWKRGFVHRPLLKFCNYATWAINFLSVDRDRSETGVVLLECHWHDFLLYEYRFASVRLCRASSHKIPIIETSMP